MRNRRAAAHIEWLDHAGRDVIVQAGIVDAYDGPRVAGRSAPLDFPTQSLQP